VEVRLDEADVDVRVEVIRRNDVEDGEPRHRVGMIERHAVADTAATVLADERKALEASRA
jgi:hypothetical protein